MSHAMTFDTLAFVKKLEASGITSKQSEAITGAVADVYENNLAVVATKSDIDALEVKIDGKLLKLKSEVITWVVGLVFAQTAMLSIIKFMH